MIYIKCCHAYKNPRRRENWCTVASHLTSKRVRTTIPTTYKLFVIAADWQYVRHTITPPHRVRFKVAIDALCYSLGIEFVFVLKKNIRRSDQHSPSDDEVAAKDSGHHISSAGAQFHLTFLCTRSEGADGKPAVKKTNRL